MKIDAKKFGAGLATLRQTRGLSQAAVARNCNLSVNYISLIETGARQPSLEAINKLAEAMNVPAEFLLFLGGEDPAPTSPFRDLIKMTCNAIFIAVEEDQRLSRSDAGLQSV